MNEKLVKNSIFPSIVTNRHSFD